MVQLGEWAVRADDLGFGEEKAVDSGYEFSVVVKARMQDGYYVPSRWSL